ncbi:MAG: hypothetical protein LBN09_05745 [Clostridioides sp.]|nr:hypothetical protein [Clostridioides sp.]
MENKNIELTEDMFEVDVEIKSESWNKDITNRAAENFITRLNNKILRNKLDMLCIVVLLLICTGVMLAPLSLYDPEKMDIAVKFAKPSISHLFGTDEFGRDYFTRALYGGRVSLFVGIMSMIISVALDLCME